MLIILFLLNLYYIKNLTIIYYLYNIIDNNFKLIQVFVINIKINEIKKNFFL